MAHRPGCARPLPTLRRSAAERLAAWLCTGPLGHLYGVAADVVEVGGRYVLRRARARARARARLHDAVRR